MLDLSDAHKKLNRADYQLQQVIDIERAWRTSEGNGLLFMRNEVLAHDEWLLQVAQSPPDDLVIIAGEYFNSVRSALDYVAWAIFVAGGGGHEDPRRKRIYFPIASTDVEWRKGLKGALPLIWPEAKAIIESHQPFAETGDDAGLLTALAEANNLDKHRQLQVVGIGNISVSAVAQELPDGVSFAMGFPHPIGPLRAGYHLVSQYMFHAGDRDQPVARWAGMDMEIPPQPELEVGIMGTGVVSLSKLPRLLAKVRSIVQALEGIDAPARAVDGA